MGGKYAFSSLSFGGPGSHRQVTVVDLDVPPTRGGPCVAVRFGRSRTVQPVPCAYLVSSWTESRELLAAEKQAATIAVGLYDRHKESVRVMVDPYHGHVRRSVSDDGCVLVSILDLMELFDAWRSAEDRSSSSVADALFGTVSADRLIATAGIGAWRAEIVGMLPQIGRPVTREIDQRLLVDIDAARSGRTEATAHRLRAARLATVEKIAADGRLKVRFSFMSHGRKKHQRRWVNHRVVYGVYEEAVLARDRMGELLRAQHARLKDETLRGELRAALGYVRLEGDQARVSARGLVRLVHAVYR